MSKQDLDYFLRIPWCTALINDPQYTVDGFCARPVKQDGKDAFFSETVNTGRTISACVSLFKKPADLADGITEIHTLMALEAGLDGYPGVCHGGMVATLLDEVMSEMHWRNKTMLVESGRIKEMQATLTVALNVRYFKPVRTPQTVLVTAAITKTQGRKIWVMASIKDAAGDVLSTAEGIFVRVKRSSL